MTTKCSVLIIHERLGHSDISTGRHRHNRCNIGNFTGQLTLVFELMLTDEVMLGWSVILSRHRL